jgi:hypothetical protein
MSVESARNQIESMFTDAFAWSLTDPASLIDRATSTDPASLGQENRNNRPARERAQEKREPSGQPK